MKAKLLLFALLVTTLCPSAALGEEPGREDALYADGTKAINDGRWSEAESIFDSIVQQHGSRAEASLYWKAYAESKEGKANLALATCNQLRLMYPHGRWMNECGALEIEIRGKSNNPLPPQEEQDEELKLLALNALMQQDEAKSLPIIEQILSGHQPDKLKERALFVLAQSHSQQGQAVLDQVARGQHDPTLQQKAIQMMAVGEGQQAAPRLEEIYRQTGSEEIKRSILHSYLMIGTPDPLVEAARHESNPHLLREAVHALGAMGATQQLASLYHDSHSAEARGDVIEGLFIAGDSHDLVQMARDEKDPALRKEIVQQLGMMRSKEASDYMLEILNK